jgi:hypothetical protein
MPTTPNPPIPGHHLLNEGHTFPVHHNLAFTPSDAPIEHNGGCQCGAKPPDFPNVSKRRMQEWHRQHKEELRGGPLRVDRVRLLHQVLDDAEEALRLGDMERMHKVIFVWSQRREHLLAGEETWEDQHI